MHFAPNTLVSLTELTRYLRVRDIVLDSWCKEGILPEPLWVKGRRYWQSDELNALFLGCVIKPISANSKHSWFEKTLKAAGTIICVGTAFYLF